MEYKRSVSDKLLPKQSLWSSWPLAVAIVLGSLGFFLFFLNRDTIVPVSWGSAGGARNRLSDWINAFQQSLIVPLIGILFGVLIVRQRPRHRIGLLLIIIGLMSAAMMVFQEWSIYGYHTTGGSVPGWRFTGWITNWIWIVLFFFVLLLVPLFPDGAFLSRRWRTFILILLSLFVLPLLIAASLETPMSSAAQIPNPFVETHPAKLYETLYTMGVPFMPLATVAGLAAVLARFRRSQGRERQQIKWLLAGMAVMAVMVAIGLSLSFLGQTIGDMIVNAAVLAPFIGIGVALVRHHLYDIDVIIRRTLLYTAVSAILAIVYLGSVILLQQLFSSVTGQQSAVAIVISTLLIAALFAPLRHRLQALIDHRFYRQKYDAAQTLAQFAQTARDETDIEALQAELLRVVQETLQPQSVTVWFKQSPNGRQ
jgi:hypothetical protein